MVAHETMPGERPLRLMRAQKDEAGHERAHESSGSAYLGSPRWHGVRIGTVLRDRSLLKTSGARLRQDSPSVLSSQKGPSDWRRNVVDGEGGEWQEAVREGPSIEPRETGVTPRIMLDPQRLYFSHAVAQGRLGNPIGCSALSGEPHSPIHSHTPMPDHNTSA